MRRQEIPGGRRVFTMGESKDYMTLPEQNGSVNIAKDVIAAVAVDAVR